MNEYLKNKFNIDADRPAGRAVLAILVDLTDRRGLRQEWEAIDADIQQEIVIEWTRLIGEAIQ